MQSCPRDVDPGIVLLVSYVDYRPAEGLAPVAVAVVMVGAGLAASRGGRPLRGALRLRSGRPGPGSARRSHVGTYATAPACDEAVLAHRLLG